MHATNFTAAVEFGKKLLRTEDLDPVYVALHKSNANTKELYRTLLAYSCTYHLSSAVFMAQREGENFWNILEQAAINKDLQWPRGAERRHWRGQTSILCTKYLRQNFKYPEDVASMWLAKGNSCYNVFSQVRSVPYFGPWIAFKVADLLDRVAGKNIDFSKFALGVYEEPRKGAALLLSGNAEQKITDQELELVVSKLKIALGSIKAPPAYERKINVQEIETILCKYKSHVNCHYPLGKDTHEVFHGLQDVRFNCVRVEQMKKTIAKLISKHWS